MENSRIYKIVFSGEIVEGFELAAVKNKAAQVFKMDGQKLEALFQGSARTLKKNLDDSAAKKYQKILTQIGMVVSVEVEQDQNTATELSEVEKESSESRINHNNKLIAESNKAASWQVETAGSLLLTSNEVRDNAEVKPVIVPTYDVAPVAQNLLRSDETEALAEKPSLSAYQSMTLHEVGEDILSAEEKPHTATAEIDTQGLSVGSVGEELLMKSEKQTVKQEAINTDDIQLSTH